MCQVCHGLFIRYIPKFHPILLAKMWVLFPAQGLCSTLTKEVSEKAFLSMPYLCNPAY